MTLPVLETPRLTLAPATAGDVDALWAIWRHPDVRRYLFDDIPVTRERASQVLTESLALTADGLGIWLLRSTGIPAIIGCVGLVRATTVAEYDPRLAGAVEVVASLAPAVWGRGYAAEALGAVLTHAFTSLGLETVVAAIDAPNAASVRLVERLGFLATGECPGRRYRLRTYALRAAAVVEPTPGAHPGLPQ